MLLSYIGRRFIEYNRVTGTFVIFVCNALWSLIVVLLKRRFYFGQFIKFFFQDVLLSMPIVALTASVIGSILVLQIYAGITEQYVELAVARIVVVAIIRDLAPVFMGFLLAGRLGTSFASKISSMNLTEQLDALETLSVSPIHYLVLPKVLSGILTFAVIYCFGVVFGIFGGYLSASSLGFNTVSYLINTYDYFEQRDFCIGLVKSSLFGLIVSFISCYVGLKAARCSHGVGEASTKAIVVSTVWILILNYIVNRSDINV